MVVTGAARCAYPVVETYALFEGGVALAHKARFIDADGRQRAADGREAAFAYADDADIGRFHHGDAHALLIGAGAQCARQKSGGEPAGAAAADDHYVFNVFNRVRGGALRRCCGAADGHAVWSPCGA